MPNMMCWSLWQYYCHSSHHRRPMNLETKIGICIQLDEMHLIRVHFYVFNEYYSYDLELSSIWIPIGIWTIVQNKLHPQFYIFREFYINILYMIQRNAF